MKYVLIFIVWAIAGGGAPATAEFNSADACMTAAKDLEKKLAKPSYWVIHCYPKGKEE
jgi:hypothetical protein